MKGLIVALCLLQCGCTGLDKLLGNDSLPRDIVYGFEPPPSIIEPQEPYATKAGTHTFPDGSWEQLYLIHWSGNALDNTSHLESEIDALGIPKQSY